MNDLASSPQKALASSPQSAEAGQKGRAAPKEHRRRWWILAVIGLAQLMVVLDATVVNIALPSAQRALHFSNSDRQWIITGYSLAFGSLLLLGGKLNDLLGRKWTFVGGMVGFAVVSAIGGSAQSFAMLAAARTLQGAFGALLAPSALALLTVTFTDGPERNKAFGIFGAIAGSGASVGLLLGGVLTQYLSWRWCLYVNLFVGALAVSGALVLVANSRPQERPQLDIPGTLAVCAGLFAIVFGFSHAQTSGWGDPLTIAMLVLGALLLAVFTAVEARVEHPLLPLRILADRNRAASYIAVGVASAAMFGVFLFLTYYLQQDRGYSPVTTGLAFLPMTAVVMLTAVLTTTVMRERIGPRVLTVLGMAFGAGGMAWLTGLGLHTSYASGILPPLLLVAIGIGMVFASGMFGATLGVRGTDAGVASATVNASQQVGGALGTALLSTIAASAAAGYISSHLHGARPAAPVLAAGAVSGYTVAFAVSAGIFALGALAAMLFEGRARAVSRASTGEPLAAMH
jgi:EmrB/QacA subfamily drug resistance transporter